MTAPDGASELAIRTFDEALNAAREEGRRTGYEEFARLVLADLAELGRKYIALLQEPVLPASFSPRPEDTTLLTELGFSRKTAELFAEHGFSTVGLYVAAKRWQLKTISGIDNGRINAFNRHLLALGITPSSVTQ